MWKDYVFHKQTVRELSETSGKDKRTIRALLCSYTPPQKVHHPRSVHLVVDATYFGERKEGTSWCVVVARDHEHGEDLVWRFASTESTSVYASIRNELEDLGILFNLLQETDLVVYGALFPVFCIKCVMFTWSA